MKDSNIFKSRLPSIEIPHQDLPTFWFSQMRQINLFMHSSPRPVFIDGIRNSHERLYLKQMQTMCLQLASGMFHDMGVRAGDMVGIVLPNTIYYLVCTLAVQMLGATCTPANPAYTADELRFQISHSGAKFVIAAPTALSTIKQAVAGILPYPQNVLYVPTANHTDTLLNHEQPCPRSIFTLLCDKPFSRFQPQDLKQLQRTPAFVCYSSGTTGLPKGAMLSHYNVVANILQGVSVQKQMTASNRTTLAVLPLFHSFGLVLMAHSLPLCGSSLVIMRSFDMSEFLYNIEAHRVTDTLLVPPVINALAKLNSSEWDISSLKWVISGASPLSSSTIKSLELKYPHICVMQGYGLTETSPGLSLNVPGRRNQLSSGELLPNLECKVVDDKNNVLSIGSTGELCFRGPNIMMGYINEYDATKHIIMDGFLHTGDVGRIDPTGHVFVTDRKKELIKFNGFQVAPAEIEGILLQHPLVRDCAVVGTFCSKRQTELPRVFLVLNQDEKLHDKNSVAEQVVEWINSKVAYYKRLRGGFVVVDEIPKNASGKVLRRVLKESTVSSNVS
ncbi:hypothetical protein IWW36_003162 [Coemansia brasiliensis]|uniref:Acetyl-CoA synthetase-like protein n=1 Tax=Coemansia brasiliensis TaxID=2650707 RepID=A0A9W8IEJ3_9FUNG|nr:hypothetical protein IWW36_003162 [Coemansia brasiliensis]